MKSLADGLPVEIARQVHADWHKNEAAYWTVRNQLLDQYQGQWIGFANGAVVASGHRPVMVLHAARQAAEHPYIICVGREDEPYRMRRTDLPGCLTQGAAFEEARENLVDAVEVWLMSRLRSGEDPGDLA
jgi:predicted RNase H-like HicB family nuclease